MPLPLEGKRILITGVGLRPVRQVFADIATGRPTHTEVADHGQTYKANIGAATAYACVKSGAAVHMVARSEAKLAAVRDWIFRAAKEDFVLDGTPRITFSAADLASPHGIARMVRESGDDLPLSWVQSLGLGAGTVQLPDDNPYLRIEDLTPELIDAELGVLTSTITALRALLPVLRRQQEAKVCVVTSMSAVRSINSGSIHAAAKGALSRFTNAASLELSAEGIYLTDIRPGGVDTGIYDSPVVQQTINAARAAYGYPGPIRLIPPTSIGETIAHTLASDSHITTVNLVSRGQMPHTAS
ncbi:SDR family oxidoreductase [Streptomyces sp. ISL-43]|uniref:SDR family NAD(P)-dependent oxidoreductase n=1 Tax=Streptomyces sp. ISL-43 TaxID=2819183 RepID=UPI001BECE261|nr:SDR family oxidoreductase [Streptomyces sp. ISL-43]MBT2453147.1 SDR family oxidoreductase [Streptomyces sp. ISL-43]